MDIAAAAVSFISIAFQSFQGCVQAFEFFSTAQQIGADGDLFRTGLEFEKYRLIAWAQRVGLGQSERQTVNWQLAGLLLNQLQSFLTSADKLRARYSLDVTEETVQLAERVQATSLPRSGMARLIAQLKPNIYTTAGKIIQENNSTLKRLRWATRDKEKLKRFLNDIADLIDKLEMLLDRAEREQEKGEYDRLLRNLISLSSTTTEVKQIRELVRLVIGADSRDDEIRPQNPREKDDLPKLKVLKRSLKGWNSNELHSTGLSFATYSGRQVLIQWKIAEGAQWEKYAGQMKCLAVLLMSLNHQSFRALPCLGYFPMQNLGRHGIVYSMPDDDEIDWDCKSLRDLITNLPRVSLRRRLEIAQALAETMLQLHTSGWMHKNLRSENIIFLAPCSSDDAVFLNSDPYIVGYDYARSDTDEDAAAYTQLPDTDLEAELYRHPQSRGPNRETYQKRFDMYALACILVELVAWDHLVSVIASFTNETLKVDIANAQLSNELVELPSLKELVEDASALRFLAFQAGESMVEAIRVCLYAENDKEGEEGLLKNQNDVVETLARCTV